MPNPGDPITNIVEHRLPVFAPTIDLLIAEVVALGGRQELEDRYGLFYWSRPSFNGDLDSLRPLPEDLESELTEMRDRREREARDAGWEVDRLLADARQGRTEAPLSCGTDVPAATRRQPCPAVGRIYLSLASGSSP